MPRPPLGEAARTEVVAVRLTKQEKAILEAKYGSAAKAIRAYIETLLRPA